MRMSCQPNLLASSKPEDPTKLVSMSTSAPMATAQMTSKRMMRTPWMLSVMSDVRRPPTAV